MDGQKNILKILARFVHHHHWFHLTQINSNLFDNQNPLIKKMNITEFQTGTNCMYEKCNKTT
jgi:hypothetical protein